MKNCIVLGNVGLFWATIRIFMIMVTRNIVQRHCACERPGAV